MRAGLVARASAPSFEMGDNLDKWHEYSTPLEGRVPGLYCDIKRLITCAVGNLVDPVRLALQLPWKLDHGNGALATSAQVIAAWQDIKANSERLSRLHWKYALKRNDLRLTDEDIDHLVVTKLAEFEAFLRRYFPDWDNFPADAQLAICSMAWACGPGFPAIFTNFTRFANQHNWILAKACAKIREEGNPGIVPRNQHNRLCFDNAAVVEQYGLDLETLYWPDNVRLEEPPEPEFPADFVPQPELLPLPLPEDWHASLEAMRKADNLDLYDRF